MRELLDLPEPPTAVIAGGNQLMLGALRVVSERGVALGRELSFVGCDDVAITDLFQPAVAVVRRDNFAMGRTAAELLLARMRDEQPPVGRRPADGVRRPAELRPAAAVSRHARRRREHRHHASGRDPAGGWGNQLHEISEGNDLELWATVLVVEGARRRARRDRGPRPLHPRRCPGGAGAVAHRAGGGPAVEHVAVGTTHNHSVPVTVELGGAWIRPQPRARRARTSSRSSTGSGGPPRTPPPSCGRSGSDRRTGARRSPSTGG